MKVTGDMTCGLYVEGMPMPEMAGKEHTSVTPKTSGLATMEVRCENCVCGGPKATTCEYFEMLNKAKPEEHELDEKIIPSGCCNAFRPMEPSIEGLRKKAAKL